jgi:DNA modification methylase
VSGLLRNEVVVGDALAELRGLPDASVDMMLTSPPYFRLRDYQVAGQLGAETTVEQWAANLLAVATEVRRVLTQTGTFWLNVGDSYSTNSQQGAARKSLLLGPERLALALTEQGWVLRNKIVWAKANPMPSSVRDRLNCGHEYIYVFAKAPSYFFDLDAIRVAHTSRLGQAAQRPVRARRREPWRGPNGDDASGLAYLHAQGRVGHPLGKNPGDVWTIPSSNYRGAHHATFPVALVERAIRAGCPEARCMACRAPWRQQTIRSLGGTAVRSVLGPTCACNAASEPGVVLDPFFGAGTTAIAAERLGRDWLGIELNPVFAALAVQRITSERPRAAAHSPPVAA